MAPFSFFRQPSKRLEPASSVLFISSGGLGDTVLLAQIFKRFRAVAGSQEKISLLLRKDAAKMSFLFSNDIDIQAVDYDRFRKSAKYRNETCKRLYERNFRCVVSLDYLRHPKLDEVLAKACSASETIAMEPRTWVKYDKLLLQNREIYDRLYDSGPVHLDKVVRWSRFADWLTVRKEPLHKLGLPGNSKPEPVNLPRPTIVFVPFSAVKEKQSLPELFVSIIDMVLEGNGGFDFVVAGAPGDLAKNPSFQSVLKLANVYFDDSSFEDLAPVLCAADLVVAVDTATMHLAAALGTPTLCLASAAYINEIVPYAPEISPDNVHFIFENMECAGCLGDCHLPPENGMYPCVARLDLSMVLAKVKGLLNKSERR